MKKKNGFTLIELLAVIIILGILMIIAIPAVTSYINNSRKSGYITSAKQFVNGARNLVNEGKLDMYSTDTTYYIPVSYIKTENGLKTPYGDFTEAYIGVIFNGTNYKYYWISTDTSGTGVKNIVLEENLDENDIESDLTDAMIHETITTTGIGERLKIKIFSENENTDIVLSSADNNVSEEGGDSSSYYLYYTGDNIAWMGLTVNKEDGYYSFIGQINDYDQDFTSEYVFENYQDALNSIENYNSPGTTYQFFTRLKISDNKVVGLDIGFNYNGSIHYLIGANSSAYNANRDLLHDVFGSSNCNDNTNSEYQQIRCITNDSQALNFHIDAEGLVYVAFSDNWECQVSHWSGTVWGAVCQPPW